MPRSLWGRGDGNEGLQLPFPHPSPEVKKKYMFSIFIWPLFPQPLLSASRECNSFFSPRSQTNALCSYPHVKMEIRDSSQISTTAPIFLEYNYFRQKYLEIASCSDSLLIYIWVRVDHSLLKQKELPKNQLQFKHSAGRM